MNKRAVESIFIVLLCVVYLPILIIDFGLHVDYARWASYRGTGFFVFPESNYLFMIGRPISAILVNLQCAIVQTIHDFSVVRAITFVLMALCAISFYIYIKKRLLIEHFWALTISFCVFTLPPMQTHFAFISSGGQGPATILFVIFAYLLVDRVRMGEDFSLMHAKLYILYMITACIIYLIAMFCYPPNAMFFLVFTFAHLIFSNFEDYPKTRFIIIRDILFCGISMILFFFLLKFIYLPFMQSLSPEFKSLGESLKQSNYRFVLNITMARGLIFGNMSTIGFGGIYDLWFAPGKVVPVIIGILTSGITFIFIRLFFTNNMKDLSFRRKLGWSLQMAIIAIVIVLMVNAPVLLSNVENSVDIGYRIYFPFSAIVVLVLCWVFIRIGEWLDSFKMKVVTNSVAVVMLVSFALIAEANLLYTAINANRELNLVRQKLASRDLSKIRSIIVIEPSRNVFFNEKHLKREFGYTATDPLVNGLPFAVLSDMGVKRLDVNLIAVKPSIPATIFIDDSVVLIDMNELSIKKNSYKPNYTIIASPIIEGESGMFDRRYALDNNSDTFWEEVGTFPFILPINFYWVEDSLIQHLEPISASGVKVMKYLMRSLNDGGARRMPTDWKLQGSNNGVSWIDVDVKMNQQPWVNKEDRFFDVTTPDTYRFYRLYIIKASAGDSNIIRLYDITLRK